ncbi:MAG: hypothetical protein J6K55_02710 [Clostridia bacterium]|nr:hypothetical protein [Clostridia bacterium]
MSRYNRGYSEPSVMNGILFLIISIALTVVITMFPGKALFEWIHKGLNRLAYDGELVGYDPVPLAYLLPLPIIGTLFLNIAFFNDNCDTENWLVNSIIVAVAALCLSLGLYAIALIILFVMLLPLIKYGTGLERMHSGFSRVMHPRDAMDATEQFAKEHPGILLHEMLCDEDESWFRDAEDDDK